MSLNWNWNKKVGRVYCRSDVQVRNDVDGYWANLYVGNAWLIEIWEDEDRYQLTNFFADKEHMKNCTKDECFKGYHAEYYFYVDMLPELRKGFIESFVRDSQKMFSTCQIHFVTRIIPEEEGGE